ncbi:MAG: hypothetical protein U5R14_02025 [Gemmatimonadota bacterium]|nr:hypothetical protein [Gemmatimonadota bacterium]
MAASKKDGFVKLRLLFVDQGDYHDEKVDVPGAGIDDYERLIDFLREDPAVLKHLHLDMDRLCAAYRIEE